MFTVTILANADGAFSLSTIGNPHPGLVAALLRDAAATIEASLTIALPDGWAATDDGVNVHMLIGGETTYSRTYRNGDRVVEAPCGADGRTLPATADVLNAPAVEFKLAEQPAS